MNFRKKLIAVLLTAVYILGGLAVPAQLVPALKAYAAETVTIVTVTADGVNIRTGPGTEFRSVGVASEGDVYTALSTAKDTKGMVWYNVLVDGTNCYIRSDFCKTSTYTVDNPTSASPTTADSGGSIVVVTGSVVNIRSEAKDSSKRITVAQRGDTFELLGKESDSSGILWYKIKVDGKTGFISSAYGTVRTTATTVDLSKKESYLTVSSPVVNYRSGAGTSYSKLGTLRKGDKYTIIGNAKDSGGTVWYKINVSGVNAYICSSYVTVEGSATTTTTTKPTSGNGGSTTTTKPSSTASTTTTTIIPTTTTTKSPGTGSEVRSVKTGTVNTSSDPLTVRSGAGTNYSAIGKVAKGSKVVIVGSSNGWYKIEYKASSNGYGYVKSSYISNVSSETTLVTLAFGTSYYYVNLGGTVTVSASASGYDVKYSISNPDAAPIDATTGKVTGKVPGMYTVTAKSGSLSATAEVVVLKAPNKGVQPMTISQEGVEFIAQWEGGGAFDAKYNEVTFTPYKDEVGYWTIGYGHAKVSAASKSWSYERAYSEFNTDIEALIGKEHIMTDAKPYLNQEEAYMLLNADLIANGYVGAISNWAVRNGIILTQPQFDSLVSFCFNLGVNYWTSDTYLFYLKSAIMCQRSGDAANKDQIIEGFCRYMKASGLNLKGLWWRRRNEAEMFIEGDYAIDRENKFTLPSGIVWS